MRALSNLIGRLYAEHEFYIFTRNHDYLQADIYSEIEANVWHRDSNASIYYTDEIQCKEVLAEQISKIQPDWIYLQGA